MQTVMTDRFSIAPQVTIPRSTFKRDHGLKTTINADYLYPILVDEVLPGDGISARMTGFARMATPLNPLMDNMFMETFFFFVPMRLLWDNWSKFNGEQTNPGDSTDYLIPQLIAPPAGGHAEGSLSDYMGIPTKINSLQHSSMWHRAYNLIWNEWFRDQNLQNSLSVPLNDGPDTDSDFVLQRRGKRHDYFSSALPWPQKGASVGLPLGTTAPVKGIGVPSTTYGTTGRVVNETGASGTTVYANSINISSVESHIEEDPNNSGFPGIYTDLTAATAATINELREAFQIQKFLERDSRGGTRLIEIVRSHFGVTSSDLRITRPEFLGGGSSPVGISAIAQTSSTDATTPQGNLAAMGTVQLNSHGFTKSFTEHGVILGLVNVRADLTYQQGLNRMFSRRTREEFYWPTFAHLGEQEIKNKEIFADGTATDELVFGYQERYAEYRYKPSSITGLMRSNAAQSLDVWHLSQDFSTLPTLSSTFIESNTPMARVEAVPSEPDFIFDAFFKYQCARPMPMYSVPGFIDHF